MPKPLSVVMNAPSAALAPKRCIEPVRIAAENWCDGQSAGGTLDSRSPHGQPSK
jgi:hypothetical protein